MVADRLLPTTSTYRCGLDRREALRRARPAVVLVGPAMPCLALAAHCRFRNCTHELEPACAVQAALDAEAIDPDRVDSYRKLMLEQRSLRDQQQIDGYRAGSAPAGPLARMARKKGR